MKLKAEFIKKCDGFNDARLYHLSKPVNYSRWINGRKKIFHSKFVIVSCVYVIGPETYIFPSTKNGRIKSWGELSGSFQGAINHKRALRNAGYNIVKGSVKNAK